MKGIFMRKEKIAVQMGNIPQSARVISSPLMQTFSFCPNVFNNIEGGEKVLNYVILRFSGFHELC